MRNLLTALSIIIIGMVLAYFIATGKSKPEKTSEQMPEPIAVNAQEAEPFTDAVAVKTYGIIEARTSITVSPEVSGKIIYVHPNFTAGGRIEKNETLLKIEDSQYQSDIAMAESNLAKAEETYATEQARSQQAKKEWRDLGSKAANDLFLRKPQLASSKAQVKASTVAVKRAQTNLQNTRIRLPFTAHLTATDANLGQFVLPGANLAKAYNKSQLQVRLPLSQNQLSQLNLGWPVGEGALPKVVLTLQMGRETLNFDGRILQTSAQIEANNQTLHFIAGLPKHAEGALPGQYVEAQIHGKSQDNIYRLPKTAFHDKHFILQVKEQKLHFVDATLFNEDETHVYLKAQLPANSIIVIERVPLATEGMAVKLKES